MGDALAGLSLSHQRATEFDVGFRVLSVKLQQESVIVHTDANEILGIILRQDGTVLGVARDCLKDQARHFIGSLQTVSHRFGRRVWVAQIVRAVVVLIMHDQAGAFWQEDRLSVLVIALPVKVPVLDPNQPPLFPAGEQSITLQVLAQIMSMGKDPQQTYIYGEHIRLLDEVVGGAGWYREIEAGQLDSKRH